MMSLMSPHTVQRLSLARILALARKPAWPLYRLNALASLLMQLPASSSSLCFAQSASHPLDTGMLSVKRRTVGIIMAQREQVLSS